jgi:hypothetical protein
MSNEAVRFYPLDQWPGMADLPQTRDMSRQMTFPWSAAHKSMSGEQRLINGNSDFRGFRRWEYELLHESVLGHL